MVLKIISDASVHSHATAFTLSSLQTETEELSKVLSVQLMSQLCPRFIAPGVLLLLSPSSFLVLIMAPFDLHAEACVLAFMFVRSGDQFFGKTNKTSIQSKLKVKNFLLLSQIN